MAGLGRRAGAAGADVVGGGRRRQPRRRSCRFRRGGSEWAGRGGERTNVSAPDGRRRPRRRASPAPRVAANVAVAAVGEQETNGLAF